jgi:hypothetical protein
VERRKKGHKSVLEGGEEENGFWRCGRNKDDDPTPTPPSDGSEKKRHVNNEEENRMVPLRRREILWEAVVNRRMHDSEENGRRQEIGCFVCSVQIVAFVAVQDRMKVTRFGLASQSRI